MPDLARMRRGPLLPLALRQEGGQLAVLLDLELQGDRGIDNQTFL
jgi:hypothetical protein